MSRPAAEATQNARVAEPGVTVVIPALNEEAGIRPTLEQLNAMAKTLGQPCEILVVDDGSSDGTRAVAEEAGARVISHPKPGGYGHALKTGIRHATHETIVIIDADATYPVDEIPTLVAKIGDFDLVVGARTGPHYRKMALLSPMRTCFLLLTNFVSGTWIPDPNSGLRAFRRSEVLPLLDRLPRAFSFTTTQTLIMTLEGAFICYHPVAYHRRVGKRKVRIVRDTLRVAQTLVEVVLRHNPLKLFLLLALLPFLAAIIVGFAAPDPGGTIAAAVLLGTSIVTFAVGMLSVVALPQRPK